MGFNESRKIKEARKKLEKNLKAAVVIMGNDALNHFKESFRNQGFTNEGLERWQPRKRLDRERYSRGRYTSYGAGYTIHHKATYGTRAKVDQSRAILVKTGRLRRSLTKVNAGLTAIKIKSDVPYAVFHNEGTGRLPKRQFVGHSRKLIDSLRRKIDAKVRDSFK